MKRPALALFIFSCTIVHAQEAARIIDAFSNRCPLTAGGATNPLNQAMADITRSGEMLNAIQTDREGGQRCAGAVQAAQQQFSLMNRSTGDAGSTSTSSTSGGSTGTTGGDGKDGNTGGSSSGSTTSRTSGSTSSSSGSTTSSTGSTSSSSSDESYTNAFNNLMQEAQIAEYERQISDLTAEAEDTATTADRQIAIQNEIAHLQSQINSIQMELRISAERSRLTVYRHVSSASTALLGAIQSCQSFPDIMAQLTSSAINIGSSLGAIGGASALALDAISDLIGGIVAFFRDRDIRETRADLERAYAPTAVRCAYLTLGEQFCHTLDLRRTYLYSGGNPRDLLSRDSGGRCEMTGFDLLDTNIRATGGLASSIGEISQVLNRAAGGPGAMSELDRLVFGNGGSSGLYDRIQQMDNYYDYVNRSLRHDLSTLLERRRTTTDAAERTSIETAARRLTNMIRDLDRNITPTHELMQALRDYRNNVYDNFDPSSDTRAHVAALNERVMTFMNATGGAENFESSLQNVVDMHREALGLRWSDELAHITPTSPGLTRSEISQRRSRLRRRLQALTNMGQEEISRLASIGVADLAAVSIDNRREAISNATETQRQNLMIMGRYLRSHLNANIQSVATEYDRANPHDASRGAIRDRLRGLCESTLMLPYDQISSEMRSRCGEIIYRNEGSSNVLFSEMYRRMERGAPFSSDIACHQFNHPDNVVRD